MGRAEEEVEKEVAPGKTNEANYFRNSLKDFLHTNIYSQTNNSGELL